MMAASADERLYGSLARETKSKDCSAVHANVLSSAVGRAIVCGVGVARKR